MRDKMMTIRILVMAMALDIAFGSVGANSLTLPAAKEQNAPGTIYSSKRMPDGKQWMTENLNVNIGGSYCYEDSELKLPSIWPFVYVGVGPAGMSITERWLAPTHE